MKTKVLLYLFFLFITGEGISQQGGYLFVPNNANFVVYHSGTSDFVIRMSKITEWNLGNDIAAVASGKRVLSAKDDAAAMAVGQRMNAIIESLAAESRNAEDMRNYLRYIDSVLEQNSELLSRIRLLILRSTSGFLGPDDRELNQTEIDQMLAQIDMNAAQTEYNKKKAIPFLTVEALGLQGVDVVKNLYGSMKLVDAAMDTIRLLRSKAGIQSNVLSFEIMGKMKYAVNMQESESRLIDADIAEKVTNIVKGTVVLKLQYGVLMK